MDERKTVLVVEDDPVIREMMHDVLEDEGFRALCADSTKEAIETMTLDGGEDIAAVFADIDLGDRGGGYEVARYARRIKPGVRIIYTSGGARADFSTERVDDAQFVQKPYSPSAVCSILKENLAR